MDLYFKLKLIFGALLFLIIVAAHIYLHYKNKS